MCRIQRKRFCSSLFHENVTEVEDAAFLPQSVDVPQWRRRGYLKPEPKSLDVTAAFLTGPRFGERFAPHRDLMKPLFLSLLWANSHNRRKSMEEQHDDPQWLRSPSGRTRHDT
jgi:hypothetical protein